MRPRRPLWVCALLWLSGVGLLLLAAAFLARFLALDVGATEEARRAILRLRGMLVLLAVVGYGRYLLFPAERWRGWWWAHPPILVVLAFGGSSPLVGGRWDVYLRSAGLLTLLFGLGETVAAVLRRVWRMDLAGMPAREEARLFGRRAAAKLCLLVALAVGVGIYLLSIDYLFDYFLYSLIGMGLIVAAYLAPLGVLACAMEKAVSPRLVEVARTEEEALAAGAYASLAEQRLVRDLLLRSARLGFSWLDWAAPVGSCLLLLLAAFLHAW
ncbi:MAG: hypothetical protein GX493_09715 [Firmicutes bacterium]|nr:hypothetical protein [Bacillota bacterium]